MARSANDPEQETNASDWLAALANVPDDFLNDPAAAIGVAVAERLESSRRDVATWSSLAVVARHPEVAPHRGVKGTRTLEADLDAIVRGLIGGLRDQDPGSLRRHATWYAAVLATRTAGADALAVELDTLQEALLRWLGRQDARVASDALAAAYDRPIPTACAALH